MFVRFCIPASWRHLGEKDVEHNENEVAVVRWPA
jgi:hypothetical protein